jgi:hypothetical protein
MLSKLLPCVAVGLTIVSNCLHAAPILSVTPGGLNGGDREWFVRIAPDASLFANHPPNGIGGSLVAELAFAVENPVKLLSVAVVDRAAWPLENPGNNPYTNQVTFGTFIDLVNNRTFSAYLSAYLTSSSSTHLLTITTSGAGPTTLRYGRSASADPVKGARIAQAGTNFDGYTGRVFSAELANFDGDLDVDGADFLKWQRGESPNLGSAADLAEWRRHFSNRTFAELGDFDGDLDVDGADFLKWQRGESPFIGSAADLADWRLHFGNRRLTTSRPTAVPEPPAFSFALIACVVFKRLSSGRPSWRLSNYRMNK